MTETLVRQETASDDLAATIYHALGIDHTQEYQTRTGRPVYLVPHGSVVPKIFE